MTALTESWAWPFGQLLVSVALVATVFLAIRLRLDPWKCIAILLLPVASFYVLAPCWRIYSSHGFLHFSILYQLLNGFFPPQSPLLAGEPEYYPWAHLLPVAGSMVVLRLAPTWAFALINVAYLFGTLAIVYRTAMFLSSNRVAALLSTLMSVFGLTPFIGGPIANVLAGGLGSWVMEWRALVAVKYTLASAMPPGLMFFALFLYACARVFSGEARPRHHLALFASVAGTGYAYPLIFPALLACYAGICAFAVALRGTRAWDPLLRSAASVATATVALLPYFVLLGRPGSVLSLASDGRSSGAGASLLLAPDWGDVGLKAARVAVYSLPLALVLIWKRRALIDSWRERPHAGSVLAAATATTAALYALFSVTPPLANEYKFLMLYYLPLGILAGPAMGALYSKHRIFCLLLTAAFVTPVISHWTYSMTWRECERGIAEERHLRYEDETRDALYSWIGSQTERDAVFIDTSLDVALFGRRQLYMGTAPEGLDGWVFLPRTVLLSLHHPVELVVGREQTVRRIYARPDLISQANLEQLLRETEGKDVYVVVRDIASRAGFDRSDALETVFENEAAIVYRVAKERL